MSEKEDTRLLDKATNRTSWGLGTPLVSNLAFKLELVLVLVFSSPLLFEHCRRRRLPVDVTRSTNRNLDCTTSPCLGRCTQLARCPIELYLLYLQNELSKS